MAGPGTQVRPKATPSRKAAMDLRVTLSAMAKLVLFIHGEIELTDDEYSSASAVVRAALAGAEAEVSDA